MQYVFVVGVGDTIDLDTDQEDGQGWDIENGRVMAAQSKSWPAPAVDGSMVPAASGRLVGSLSGMD